MDVPLRPPQLAGSRKGFTIGRSQSLRNASYTLLKKGVQEMFLRSSSLLGGCCLGMGDWCSIIHWRGYSAVLVIALKIVPRGSASSTEKEVTIFLGRSPGTDEFGFLAARIFL